MQEIQGKVIKIIYQNDKSYYTIMLCRNEKEAKTFTVVGNFPIIHAFLNIKAFGKWKSHKQHGMQFETSSYEILEPENNDQLIDFLCNDLIGCPYTVAVDIARNIGLSYLETFTDVKGNLAKLRNSDGVEHVLIRNATFLISFYEKKKMLESLTKMGFEQQLSCKMVFSEFPPSIQDVKNNPYFLIKRYDVKWDIIDQIALKNGIGKSSKIRKQEAILHLLDEASNSHAHMFLPQETLDKMVKRFLGIEFNLEEELEEMENTQKVVRDLKDRIYSGENFRLEKSLAHNLYRIYKGEPIINTSSVEINSKGFPYSTDQFEAIELSLKNQLTIVSGPAGTGKTTILLKMIEALEKAGYDIQLCAPTGRAAKRMSEVTKKRAKTAHHLLGFNPETKLPSFNADMPLGKNCFIIDEVGMLDIKVASYLFDAIPNGSKVILTGDEHQLPSIGPGKFLEDLLTCGFFPTKRLNQIFRQAEGSYLLDSATKVRNGESLDLKSLPKACDFKFFDIKTTKGIQQAIEKLVSGFVKKGKYNVFDDLQIVSPIHKSEAGVKELNSIVQNIINPSISPSREITYGSKVFREGDKVIQMHNNYDKNVFNGDIGRIESVNKRSKSVIVNMSGERIEYIGEELFELDLAYVLTIHKVQGGEYPFLIMAFHPSVGDRMITRKLLYTAITRAKKQFVILSDENTIQKAIDSNKSETRFCNLIGRLKEARLKKVVGH